MPRASAVRSDLNLLPSLAIEKFKQIKITPKFGRAPNDDMFDTLGLGVSREPGRKTEVATAASPVNQALIPFGAKLRSAPEVSFFLFFGFTVEPKGFGPLRLSRLRDKHSPEPARREKLVDHVNGPRPFSTYPQATRTSELQFKQLRPGQLRLGYLPTWGRCERAGENRLEQTLDNFCSLGAAALATLTTLGSQGPFKGPSRSEVTGSSWAPCFPLYRERHVGARRSCEECRKRPRRP